eukprot:7429827-Pyramimonas_sp.AAC.2
MTAKGAHPEGAATTKGSQHTISEVCDTRLVCYGPIAAVPCVSCAPERSRPVYTIHAYTRVYNALQYYPINCWRASFVEVSERFTCVSREAYGAEVSSAVSSPKPSRKVQPSRIEGQKWSRRK